MIGTTFTAKWLDEHDNLLFEQEIDQSQIPSEGWFVVYNNRMYQIVGNPCIYIEDMTVEITCELK